MFYLYIFASVFLYLWLYKKSGDSMNPFGLSIFTFLFGASLSSLNMFNYRNDLSIETHFIICVVTLEILFLGILFCKKNHPKIDTEYYISFRFIRISRMVIALIVLGSLVNWISLGATFADFSSNVFDVKNELEVLQESSGFITNVTNYFTYLLPITPLYVLYYLLFYKECSKKEKYLSIAFILTIMFFIWMTQASRGSLLLIFIGAIYIMNFKYSFSIRTLSALFMFVVLLLAFLMTLRVNEQSITFSGYYSNIYLNHIYSYISSSYFVFDKLVAEGSPYTIFSATWVTIGKIFNPNSSMGMVMKDIDGVFNAKTFLYMFYHDLGILGVMLYPALIYSVLGYIYHMTMNSRPYYILLIAILGKAIVCVFFGNYFFGSFSNDIPYIVTFLVIWFSFYRITIKF